MKNSVHPDQLAFQKPADLDLHCFQNGITRICIDWPQSLMSFFFSKTDNLSKIAIYKLYLEVEVLSLDITKFDYQGR